MGVPAGCITVVCGTTVSLATIYSSSEPTLQLEPTMSTPSGYISFSVAEKVRYVLVQQARYNTPGV